jgi:hypothetical protein
VTVKAQAYLNHSNWVVDCPYPDCTSALPLHDGLTSVRCGYPYTHPGIPAPLPGACGRDYTVVWPSKTDFTDEHRQALAERPAKNRNWYPTGHPIGDTLGWSGQTADDIRAETRAYAPEVGTVALPDEDAEAIDRILRKHGLALSADLKHVKER